MLAGHDLGRGEIHRVEARGAETVDLHARHAVAEAGHERRRARDVAAGLADRIDAAEHHVIDQRRVELVAVLDRGERLRGEIERGHLVQRSVGLAASARGADGVVDECVGHRRSSPTYLRQAIDCEAWRDPTRLRAISSFMISLVPA